MIDQCLTDIHAIDSFNTAIIKSITLERKTNIVTVRVITDKIYTDKDRDDVYHIVKRYVPNTFIFNLEVVKLTPDEEMVRQKILEIIKENYKVLSVVIDKKDIAIEKDEKGFIFTITSLKNSVTEEMCTAISQELKRDFCGEFVGKFVENGKKTQEIVIEEDEVNEEFELPTRYFPIAHFSILEGKTIQKQAVYASDLNFEGDDIVVCGKITDIRERSYVNSRKQEKTYLNFTIDDGTAALRVTYFTRAKSVEKIQKLKVGDSIVCTGKSERYNGSMRYTANTIDYGRVPDKFVPEKRPSKPVPKYYSCVKPQPFSDTAQTDMFTTNVVPKCLMGKTFVVFDLETTGLNSMASSGNMDAIIEIGAFKVVDGVICEKFTTFVNPERKLPEDIINLTGLTDDMLKDAPTYEQVMPDFYKFCDGAILVGHNAANFDFKFVDYYCSKLGYILERKIIDTLPLAQSMLFVPNHKLNTIADYFNIKFNHHRAVDDAYVTAKIFIELIKLKKSLPNLS